MKTEEGVLKLEEVRSYSPTVEGVWYTDITQTRVFIPMKVLVRLYEGSRELHRRRGGDWEEFCDNLFK